MNKDYIDLDFVLDASGNEVRVGDTVIEINGGNDTAVVTRVSTNDRDKGEIIWGVWLDKNGDKTAGSGASWIEATRCVLTSDAKTAPKVDKVDARNVFGPGCTCEDSTCDHEFKLANRRIAELTHLLESQKATIEGYKKEIPKIVAAHEKVVAAMNAHINEANVAEAVARNDLEEFKSIYQGDVA